MKKSAGTKRKAKTKRTATAQCLEGALIALLAKKDFNTIAIKELCDKAGVNRSTFYLHYRALSDLLDETISHLNDLFVSYFPSGESAFIETVCSVKTEGEAGLDKIVRDYLVPCLTFVRDNRDAYRAAFRNSSSTQLLTKYNDVKSRILVPILDRLEIPRNKRKYYVSYFVSGLIAIAEEWMNGGCRESPEEIAQVMKECITAEII